MSIIKFPALLALSLDRPIRWIRRLNNKWEIADLYKQRGYSEMLIEWEREQICKIDERIYKLELEEKIL